MANLGYSKLTRNRDSLLDMNKQSINQLDSYYRKCVETDYNHTNFEKIVVITCILISEARMSFSFSAELRKHACQLNGKSKNLFKPRISKVSTCILRQISLEKLHTIDFLRNNSRTLFNSDLRCS